MGPNWQGLFLWYISGMNFLPFFSVILQKNIIGFHHLPIPPPKKGNNRSKQRNWILGNFPRNRWKPRLFRSWPLWLCCVVLLSPAWLGTWRPFPRRTVGPEGVVGFIFFVFFFFWCQMICLGEMLMSRWDVDEVTLYFFFGWDDWSFIYNMFPMVFYKFWFWNPMECVLRWDAREATELAHIYACVLWMGGWWAGHISSGGGLRVIMVRCTISVRW